MARTQKIYSLLSCILFFVGCSDRHEPSSSVALEAPKMDAFLHEVYQAYPLPGITVGVVTEDASYVKALGYANIESRLPLTDSTVFFSGNFSELLVTTAALVLQQDGAFSLADPVVQRLPYFQAQGAYDQISLHHLLSHTSGISHFSPAWDMPTDEPDALEGTTRSIVYQELESRPGSRCKRSPYNFDIAADLLAKTSKKDFEEMMEDKVLSPLGMSLSGFTPKRFPADQLAQPHQIADWLKYQIATQPIYPYTRENAGSYGLHTTMQDLSRWMKEVLKIESSGVLQEASIDEFLKPQYQTGEQVYKGYGWDIIRTGNEFIYKNSWSIGGFSGDMTLFPSRKLGIVIMANTEEDFNPAMISDHIAHLLGGGELEKVKTPVHIAMSRQLDSGKNVDEVLDWYGDLIAEEDGPYLLSPALLGQLGVNLLHRLSRKEDALKVFGYAVEKYPDSAEAHLNLTEALLVLRRIDEAQAHFDTAKRLGVANTPYVSFLQEQLAVALENRSTSS